MGNQHAERKSIENEFCYEKDNSPQGVFDQEIWIQILKTGFRICNPTRNPKTDFNAEISVFGFSFLPFDLEIRKRF